LLLPLELLERWDDFRHINLSVGICFSDFSFALELLTDFRCDVIFLQNAKEWSRPQYCRTGAAPGYEKIKLQNPTTICGGKSYMPVSLNLIFLRNWNKNQQILLLQTDYAPKPVSVYNHGTDRMHAEEI